MMRLITHFDFDVQGRPIDVSGQNNHGHSTAINASVDAAGRKAAGFFAPTSRIVVPHNASWGHIGAIRIEARLRIDALSGQTNIIEIDKSVALSVRSDGVVTFAIYAPKPPDPTDPDAGIDSFTNAAPPIEPTDPFGTVTANPLPPFTWVGLNTDAGFAPDAVARGLDQGEYASVMAEHDGLGTMRIWINGTLAAIRQDLEHRVLPLVPPGQVTIGARPQDNAHTLRGVIDELRIWREDPQAPYEQFFCRPISPEAKKCWRIIYRWVAQGGDDPGLDQARKELLSLMDDFIKALAKALARLDGEDRQRLFVLSRSYQRLWCQNELQSEAFASVIADILDLIDTALPGAVYELFGNVVAKFSDPKIAPILELGKCVGETDPAWEHYIKAISKHFPLPPGVKPPDRDDPDPAPKKPYAPKTKNEKE